MIDLHAHILPAVDDGPVNLGEALAMARAAAADGVRTIVATPHSGDWQPPLSAVALRSRVAQLQVELDREGVPISLVMGMEVYLDPDTAWRAVQGSALCLGETNYLLVELPLHEYPSYTERALFELQARGFRPILAHPERNAVLAREPGRLAPLVERGILAQVTAGSLAGRFGRHVLAAAELMVEHRLVHIIASDAHGFGSRSPVMSVGVAAAAALVGAERARAMVTTIPAAILAGQGIIAEPPLPLTTRRRSWL
jgi:protein-tyrosine phosphatase